MEGRRETEREAYLIFPKEFWGGFAKGGARDSNVCFGENGGQAIDICLLLLDLELVGLFNIGYVTNIRKCKCKYKYIRVCVFV